MRSGRGSAEAVICGPHDCPDLTSNECKMLRLALAVSLLALVGAEIEITVHAWATKRAPPLQKVHVENGRFVDESGRVVMFRGITSSVTSPPWYDDQLANPFRIYQMAKILGFNVVRLGAMWSGLQPDEGYSYRDRFSAQYTENLEHTIRSLAGSNIYTLFYQPQYLLWKFESEIYDPEGHFGFPEWLHETKWNSPGYPWPLGFPRHRVQPLPKGCKYLHLDVSESYQCLYDLKEYAEANRRYWEYMAQVFANRKYVLGYELLNEPWVGNVHKKMSLLLPGIAGRYNLAKYYDYIQGAMRRFDKDSLIFWQPVKWAFLSPAKAGWFWDKFLERYLSLVDWEELAIWGRVFCSQDFLEVVRVWFDGHVRPHILDLAESLGLGSAYNVSAWRRDVTPLMKPIGQLSNLIGCRRQKYLSFQGGYFDRDPDFTVNWTEGHPSALGPGFESVPGGPQYLNRTVMAWTYHCWALGNGREPNDTTAYDAALRTFCQNLFGPHVFDTVDLRAQELGNSASMLTEFGYCTPTIDAPNSENTLECDGVMKLAEKHLQSWIYVDNWPNRTLWKPDDRGIYRLDKHIGAYLGRPYPRATAGIPKKLSFNVSSGVFYYEFEPFLNSTLITEIVVPEVHYKRPSNRDNFFTGSVWVSRDLTWEDPRYHIPMLFFQRLDPPPPDFAGPTFIRIAP